ncbi:MAG: efflux RND transporter permease subunit [Leptospiraceae bacterium]|nr:efflux RND transporter permease subunit [Leptospiraceae bacterium]
MKLNWTGKLTSIFVKNGRLSLLLVVTLFIWGIFSFILTPKQYNPKIVAPAFQIRVEFPGASRMEVLEQVTRPLENIIRDIPEVEDIFSVTYDGGIAIVNVNFYVGENLENAKITLTDRINSRLNFTPIGARPPLIRSVDPDDVPVMTLAVQSDVKTEVELRKFAFQLRQKLIQVEGTSSIDVVGGRKRELSVLIDPTKLARSGVGINEIQMALHRQNIYAPSGMIKTKQAYVPLEVDGIIKNAKELENVVLIVGDAGLIRLKDVAEVKEGISEVEEYVRHIGKKDGNLQQKKSVVLISLAKKKTANISSVTSSIIEALKAPGMIPEGIIVEPIVNEGRVARTEIDGLIINLIQAVLIVVAILLVSLDFRAALLVGISIPLTLASVFGVGYLAGQNVNRITLFALILSLGLLVDSATVVIENIVRKLKLDKPKKGQHKLVFKMNTVIDAVNEVGIGLFISTVTTVLAFLPMAYVTGMMGPYMGPIPFFVPTALILALFIAYTINPWLAFVFIKVEEDTEKKDNIFSKILNSLNSIGNKIFDFYKGILHGIMSSKKQRAMWLIVVGILLVLSMLLPAVTLVKFRMLPKADREQFYLYIDLKAGAPLEETLRVTSEFEKKLLEEKFVTMVQSYVGRPPILDFNGLFRGVEGRMESHQATIRIGLTKPETRNVVSEQLVMGLRNKLNDLAKTLNADGSIKLKLVEDPPGPPVLSTLLLRVTGYDEKLLLDIAKDIYPSVKKIEEVVDVDISTPEDRTTVSVEINLGRASQSRISAADIVNALRTAYNGDVIGVFHEDTNIEQEYIRLQMSRKFREDKSTLDKIYVYNDLRLKVPLSELVSIKDVPTKIPLRRENNQTTVYVYGDMANRSITYAAIDLIAFLWDYKLPGGTGKILETSLFGAKYLSDKGKVVEITIGGEWELTLEVFRDLGIAMGVAVFLVYFVLVAQFSSFREPLIILSTIPLSLIGVLPGFMFLYYVSGIYFTATSMIGVIALAGIAVNNSIILLEYLNSLKSEKVPLEDALIEAGVTRFRPVMLTTVTTVLGSLTIASDPVWAGLAYAIVFGLGISSVLTLIVFPILYYMIKGKEWRMILHGEGELPLTELAALDEEKRNAQIPQIQKQEVTPLAPAPDVKKEESSLPVNESKKHVGKKEQNPKKNE